MAPAVLVSTVPGVPEVRAVKVDGYLVLEVTLPMVELLEPLESVELAVPADEHR